MPQIICLRSSAIICRICVIWGVFQVSRRKSCKQFLNMWGAARQQQQHVETTSDHNSAAGLSGCLIIVWWKHNSVEVSTFNLDIYDTWTKSDINFLLKLCILALKDFLHSPLTQLTYSTRSTMARQFISNWKWDEIFFLGKVWIWLCILVLLLISKMDIFPRKWKSPKGRFIYVSNEQQISETVHVNVWMYKQEIREL